MNNKPVEFLQMLFQAGLANEGETPVFEELTGGVASDIWLVHLRQGPVCVKRALAKLKVAQDWQASVDRNAFEAAWLEIAARIVPGAAPRVLAHDADAGMFALNTWTRHNSSPGRMNYWMAALFRLFLPK